MIFEKYDPEEDIEIGNILALIPHTNKVINCLRGYSDSNVLGICSSINDNKIEIINEGVVDVNVESFIGGLGTILTISNKKEGKCHQIPQDLLEIQQYDLPVVGKVIGIYDVYDKVKVILDNRTFIHIEDEDNIDKEE